MSVCVFLPLFLLEYDMMMITGRFFRSDDYHNSEFFVCVCGFVSSVKAGKSHNFDVLENSTTMLC